jgi:hypothetical protein
MNMLRQFVFYGEKCEPTPHASNFLAFNTLVKDRGFRDTAIACVSMGSIGIAFVLLAIGRKIIKK